MSDLRCRARVSASGFKAGDIGRTDKPMTEGRIKPYRQSRSAQEVELCLVSTSPRFSPGPVGIERSRARNMENDGAHVTGAGVVAAVAAVVAVVAVVAVEGPASVVVHSPRSVLSSWSCAPP